MSNQNNSRIDYMKLAIDIEDYIQSSGEMRKDLALRAMLSKSTLHRFLSDPEKYKLQADNINGLCKAIGRPIDAYINDGTVKIMYFEGDDVMTKIKAAINSDVNLDSKSKVALCKLMQIAYDGYVKK